ncbi:haloacid dehalogenase [Brucella endophytica]|uniref:Haloacid dehalogenase n=1 Tax=Brucella endophytica TaxID=1963359 RepID=A0A916WGJ2_9HYPH|nr:HAD family phosphatase [Brucella endophytica]GGA98782.1 haloacid dehalogenase [Brucella endophytica]
MKNGLNPFDLVIFDCDGVLVDSEPLAALAYHNVYAKQGMPIPQGTVAHGVGMKQADIILLIAELTGHHLPQAAEANLWPETRALFVESLQPTDGIADFLERLHIPRCVASSSSMERIEFSLGVTRLRGFFGDAVYSSSMVKRGKPAPDLFLYAAEKMGADPGRCVVIEDSPYGVEGAVAAGMTAIGYTGGGHSYAGHAEKLAEKGASAVYSRWDEISGYILG